MVQIESYVLVSSRGLYYGESQALTQRASYSKPELQLRVNNCHKYG